MDKQVIYLDFICTLVKNVNKLDIQGNQIEKYTPLELGINEKFERKEMV